VKLPIAAILMLAVAPATYAAGQALPALNCTAGPAKRTYGGTPWLVYACSDQHSVVFIAAEGSKPAPAVFMMNWAGGTNYQLHGEGRGDKKAIDAATRQMKALVDKDIVQLRTEASKAAAK